MEKIKQNKIIKIIKNTISVILIVFALAFILTVYMQRFSDNKMSFFKYRMFTVITGSMEPKYEVGDVLLAKEVPPSEIKVGDTISYEGRSGDVKGRIVTHEVVSIETDSDGKYLFRARGLQNIVEDPVIYEEQLYGVIVHKIAILSFVYQIISTDLGFYFCIIVPLILVIGYEIVQTMIRIEDKKRGVKTD